MPRAWDCDPPAVPLQLEEQEVIVDWIASGAAFFDAQDHGQ